MLQIKRLRGGRGDVLHNQIGQTVRQYFINRVHHQTKTMGVNQMDEIGADLSLLFPTDVSLVENPSSEREDEPYFIISDNDGIELSDIRGHYWATLIKSEKNKMSLGNQIVDHYGLNAFLQVYNKTENKIEKYSFHPLKN